MRAFSFESIYIGRQACRIISYKGNQDVSVNLLSEYSRTAELPSCEVGYFILFFAADRLLLTQFRWLLCPGLSATRPLEVVRPIIQVTYSLILGALCGCPTPLRPHLVKQKSS